MSVRGKLLPLFFPRDLRCAVCGEELATEEGCCGGCAGQFSWTMMRRHMEGLDGVYAATKYDQAVRALIFRFKYHNARYLADFFALHMRGFPREEGALLVPVPMHRRRRAGRGYCQTTELCQALAQVTGLEVARGKLRRLRDTSSQTRLAAEARRNNVEGAFVADKKRFQGRYCVLVDDVATTGATLGECARVLKEAGAAGVSAWAIAT